MTFKPPPLYNVWAGMRSRCRNPNNRQWNDYGGRGISVCERWNDYHAFAADMGNRPDGFSLDRIDNDAGYSPENCRWASRKTQQRNQRRALYVTVEGVRYRAVELSDTYGIKTDIIVSRAKRGLPLDQVIFQGKLANLSGLAMGGAASGRVSRAKTHCQKGHEYSPENTITNKQGWRRCRLCFYAKEKARKARQRSYSSPS